MTLRTPDKELDYYTLLGVPFDATSDVIKAGFRDFARRFHPDRHMADLDRVEEATRIYRRGTEAYRVLSNPEQRRFYDERLRSGERGLSPQAVAAHSQRPSRAPGPASRESVPARARPFMARAEQALAAGDLKQARLNYQVALQHDPQSTLLRQKLAEIESQLKPAST